MHWWTLLDFIERALRKLVEITRQNERDKLENDPVEFFADHFDGVSDNADKTDEADDKPGKK
jgi:hypothetical protein